MSEWDDILKVLRSENPPQVDIDRWKNAVARLPRPKSEMRRWAELAAAAVFGLLLGAAIFHKSPVSDENVSDNATIEFVVTKFR